MTYELNNNEKSEIITQHLRNLEFNKYNLTMSLKEENAVQSPNTDNIEELQTRLAEIIAKQEALFDELDSLAENK